MCETELFQRVQANLERVRRTVAEACARAGRSPDEVTLVAVTKYVDLPVIRALLRAGVTELGENRVQQLTARAALLGARVAPWDALPPANPTAPRWHMIGHLQRNKVKALLPCCRMVHSLDSERLAAELEKTAAHLDVTVDILLEVNVSGEASKFGLAPEQVPALAEAVQAFPRLRLRGLMTMAPLDPDPEHARPHFARLRALRDRLRQAGTLPPECRHLSMGMSQDYPVAVEEGATLIRVGSVLYENLPAAGD